MSMQEKFTPAMRKLAADRDLDLVVELDYANTGLFSFQPRDSFGSILRFPFNFQTGYSSFSGGIGRLGPLGENGKRGCWSGVRGVEHDSVVARVTELLEANDEEFLSGAPDGGGR